MNLNTGLELPAQKRSASKQPELTAAGLPASGLTIGTGVQIPLEAWDKLTKDKQDLQMQCRTLDSQNSTLTKTLAEVENVRKF